MKKESLPVYGIEKFRFSEDDFYASDLSTHISKNTFVLAPHRHNFYLTVLFTHGSGSHEVDFNTYPVKPGYLFALSPGQAHNWKLSANIDGYIIFHTKEFYDLSFTYEKMDNIPFFSLYNSPLVILKKEMQQISSLYSEMVKEFSGHALLKHQKLASLLNLLYIELSRLHLPVKVREKQNLHYLARLKEFELLVEKNYQELKLPNEYASLMHISPKHLGRICKECIGKTPSEIISDRIILEAKRKLALSKDTVAQVVDSLGYDDNSYFFRLFKKKTGETPLAFMNKFRKQGK